jgi:hypothetical protein
MAKHLKKLKMMLMGEDKTQEDVCAYLRAQGFEHYSNGYVSNRMTGKADWGTEEMYALADWLGIPDDEILSCFPRRKPAASQKLKAV